MLFAPDISIENDPLHLLTVLDISPKSTKQSIPFQIGSVF